MILYRTRQRTTRLLSLERIQRRPCCCELSTSFSGRPKPEKYKQIINCFSQPTLPRHLKNQVSSKCIYKVTFITIYNNLNCNNCHYKTCRWLANLNIRQLSIFLDNSIKQNY